MPAFPLQNLPPMSSIDQLAALTGLSASTIRRCVRATDPTSKWPPLLAKRLPDGQLRITAEDAAAWIAAFPQA